MRRESLSLALDDIVAACEERRRDGISLTVEDKVCKLKTSVDCMGALAYTEAHDELWHQYHGLLLAYAREAHWYWSW